MSLELHEVNITPYRKRKRERGTNLTECLTNAAFSSTPKYGIKLSITSTYQAKSVEYNNLNVNLKENIETAKDQQLASDNPYEVLRKPPKKSKKGSVCYVNPALCLKLPEKQLNPYEVRRSLNERVERSCFVNSGLNIRTEGENLAVNPFEIQREKISKAKRLGIANPALEMSSSLRIGIPFQPTVGCKIDFSSLGYTRPQKYPNLFSKEFILSPENVTKKSSREHQTLSVVNEEAIDIEEELDCFQLKLENSINEIKNRKSRGRQWKVEESVNKANPKSSSFVLSDNSIKMCVISSNNQ